MHRIEDRACGGGGTAHLLDRGTYVFFSYAAAVAAVAPEHERFVGVVRFAAAVVLKWLFAITTKIRRLEKLG